MWETNLTIVSICLDPQAEHRGWPNCNRVGWDWKIICKWIFINYSQKMTNIDDTCTCYLYFVNIGTSCHCEQG